MKVVLIAHNVRSAHNVGSLLRTADGLGVDTVYLTGFTPYPKAAQDDRLPHIQERASTQITKTALGAEESVNWRHAKSLDRLIQSLKNEGYKVVALEQTPKAKLLSKFKPSDQTALIVGSEVDGLDKKTLDLADLHIQIPMSGQKESFNVSVAAAIALYHITQADTS